MIGMVTAVLTGSAAGLLATIAAGHSAVAGFVTGGVVSVAVLVALMWFQYSAFAQAHQLRLFENEQESPTRGNGQDRRAISVGAINHGQGRRRAATTGSAGREGHSFTHLHGWFLPVLVGSCGFLCCSR
jgi:hypothetical protein